MALSKARSKSKRSLRRRLTNKAVFRVQVTHLQGKVRAAMANLVLNKIFKWLRRWLPYNLNKIQEWDWLVDRILTFCRGFLWTRLKEGILVRRGSARWWRVVQTTRPRLVRVSWVRKMSFRTETYSLARSRPNRSNQPTWTKCTPSIRIKIKVRNCSSLTDSLPRKTIRGNIDAQSQVCSPARFTTKSERKGAPSVRKIRELSKPNTRWEILVQARRTTLS